MNKTNVSILQEMMVKLGKVPNYELIHDGGGTHINTFTYRVTCDGFVANGTGRCKKDAKHLAAKNMLEVIAAAKNLPELPSTPADSPVRTPLPQTLPSSPNNSSCETFTNAIGDLKDLCAYNELQEPEYNMISDVGPPHARVFTYQCVVSTFREEGRATTKKQAKHEASRKMLERLIEVVKDRDNKDGMYSSLKKPDTRADNEASAEYAKSRYTDLSKLPTKKVNLGVKLKDYHTKLKTTYTEDSVPTRQEVLTAFDSLMSVLDASGKDISQSDREVELENVKKSFDKLLTPLNINVSTVIFDCDNGMKIIFVKLNTTPEIMESVIGEDSITIELKALTKAVQTFQVLMN